MLYSMSWRNIWRNPRRTLVILSAVTIGLWAMILLGGLMRGTAEQVVRHSIATLTGHLQVHAKGYYQDPAVDNSISDPNLVEEKLEDLLPPGSHWTSRVRLPAVAANARHSRGVSLVGIDPGREAAVSFIGAAVVAGRYLQPADDHQILVGQALLDTFQTKLGRKLILMARGASGDIVSKAFRITGVYRAETEATEKSFVFVTRSSAQEMLGLGQAVSEFAVLLPHREQVDQVGAALSAALPAAAYEVQTWEDLLPWVRALLHLYDYFILLWYLAVFVAMGFGIVNTTLMTVFERVREFGLLKALGMRPRTIVGLVLLENSFLLLLGGAAGNFLGLASCAALGVHGIDLSALSEGLEFIGMARTIYPLIKAADVITANLVVFGLGLLVCLYPAARAARLVPVKAMAST